MLRFIYKNTKRKNKYRVYELYTFPSLTDTEIRFLILV